MRTSDFHVDDHGGGQVVEICVGTKGLAPDPCAPPPAAGPGTVVRTFEAYETTVRYLGSGALAATDRTFWTHVALTDDLDQVSWLHS
jgi:hypothetical protein